MEMLWYGIVSVMVAMYVVLDGFDLGAGLLHRFIARTDQERSQILAAIGPFWDGNEVWLLAGGGTLFFAFSQAYASGCSSCAGSPSRCGTRATGRSGARSGTACSPSPALRLRWCWARRWATWC